jgi:hypothetical protein
MSVLHRQFAVVKSWLDAHLFEACLVQTNSRCSRFCPDARRALGRRRDRGQTLGQILGQNLGQMVGLVAWTLGTFPTLGLAQSLEPLTGAGGIRNPQIRLCLQSQGQFATQVLGADEVGVCAYASSQIDTLSLIAWVEARSTQALAALQDESLMSSAENCEALGAQSFAAPNVELCLWADASMISSNTLGSTAQARAQRLQLQEALNRL